MRTAEKLLKIIGVDEAGRGPLAGPVVSAAVIIEERIDGIKDSKILSKRKREILFCSIQEKSIAFGVGIASSEEIDQFNILNASLLSMERAIKSLELCYFYHFNSPLENAIVLVDGLFKIPDIPYPQVAIVKGDNKIFEISAASIIAKVVRDRMMYSFGKRYPEYKLGTHKGYPTRRHRELVKLYGPSPIHRRSFKGVTCE
ncbi:MAG: ribonuclease HII [Caldisericota bacterium]|nr:ribonuclease HII [Caldisericota bacterium]